jgi:farnesyl-diphosphate farnesyltransferase
MNASEFQTHQNDYKQQILQQVSRSFALTIPQLPPVLSRTTTIGYLLCRIVDTIEDEDSLSVDQKHSFFKEFVDVVDSHATAELFAERLLPRLGKNTLPPEKELVENCSIIIQAFLRLKPREQAILSRCVKIMSAGMLRFQKLKSLQGLEDIAHLDSYCYHVAGVVGEMLTDLFCAYSPVILKHREKLYTLAPSFGQGLQMTNILKDLWDDRRCGSCWLPRDVFQKHGYDLSRLSENVYDPAFGRGLTELIGITRTHLKNALTYTLMIPSYETGIRKFCLWAIGMAVCTLVNIKKKPDYQSGRDVKISRKITKAVIVTTNLTLRSNLLLKALFDFYTRGLPSSDHVDTLQRCRPEIYFLSGQNPLK